MRDGAIRLFRAWGISVYLHWSWILVAAIEVQIRLEDYSSIGWNVAEYVALFGIVLLHEFGHSLACRQVGGVADRILLWPLGGIAYVQPPPRPGALLWSIAAGPLVNVLLVPVLAAAWFLSARAGWPERAPDAHHFLETIAFINAGLLVFNLLPIYPLDGGQIVHALLWFLLGRARSLLVASSIGFAAGLGLVGLALLLGDVWLAILAAYLAWRSWAGFRHARALQAVLSAPRRGGLACPNCHAPPFLGPFWKCGGCGSSFDFFETGGACPGCGTIGNATSCSECGARSALEGWFPPAGAAHSPPGQPWS